MQHQLFRIGAGTCEDHRSRAKQAILSLKSKYVRWPDEKEREELGQLYKDKYNCPNAVGHGDGTLIDLAFAPQCCDRPTRQK